MSNWNLRVIIALCTFAVGLAAVKLWVAYHRLSQPSPIAEMIDAPKPSPPAQLITISASGDMSALQSWYHSSDGVSLRYGCAEYESPSAAAVGLSQDIFGQPIVERTPTLNDRGGRIGERVVLTSSIVWTEGSRLFLIRSPSLKYALLFEQSRVWADDGFCANVSALRKRLYSAMRPNNGMHPTADTKDFKFQ